MASILIGYPEDDTDFAIFGICFYLIGGVLIMRFARKLKRTGEEPQQKIVKCPNCGGNNVVEAGRIHECDSVVHR